MSGDCFRRRASRATGLGTSLLQALILMSTIRSGDAIVTGPRVSLTHKLHDEFDSLEPILAIRPPIVITLHKPLSLILATINAMHLSPLLSVKHLLFDPTTSGTHFRLWHHHQRSRRHYHSFENDLLYWIRSLRCCQLVAFVRPNVPKKHLV